MDIRFENREKFKVCGYKIVSDEENFERDVEPLWNKHETELRKIPESKSCLYGVTWYKDKTQGLYYYLVGVETAKPQDDMVCVEVPAAHFIVATIPKGMTRLEAWWNLPFEDVVPAKGYAPDESHGIYFEFYDKNGNFEIWAPVIPMNKQE